MAKNDDIISKMDELMNEHLAQKKVARRNALIYSGVLVVMLFTFAFIIKGNIIDNFSQASIEKSFNERFATIEPLLPAYLEALVDGVPEAYAKALSTELQTKLPLIQANFIKSTTTLTADLKKHLEQKLNKELGNNFVKEQIAIISGSSNNVKKAQEASDLIEKQVGELIVSVTSNFQKMFEHDVAKTFPRDDKSLLSEQDATKMLMHYLITLVDTELLAMK